MMIRPSEYSENWGIRVRSYPGGRNPPRVSIRRTNPSTEGLSFGSDVVCEAQATRIEAMRASPAMVPRWLPLLMPLLDGRRARRVPGHLKVPVVALRAARQYLPLRTL